MTEAIGNETPRGAMARRQGLTDLGPVPKRIRTIANFWGGSTTNARAMYELAQADGLVRSIDELRSEMDSVHDPKVRDELLAWLESRVR